MADNVVSFSTAKVNTDLIELLENVLKEAKEGTIHSGGIAMLRDDDTVCIVGRLNPRANVFTMIGAIDLLKRDIQDYVLDALDSE